MPPVVGFMKTSVGGWVAQEEVLSDVWTAEAAPAVALR